MSFNPNKNNYLSQIVGSGLCVGCGLCVGLFGEETVRFGKNSHDYFTPLCLRPLTLEQKVLLSNVCPAISVRHTNNTSNYHPIWGPNQDVLVAYAADAQIRYLGSSGGVISALSIYLLESGSVDFILQIGASSKNPLYNEIKISRCREEVLSCAGSRYSPSAPLSTMNDMLNSTERFAFVGKPCDVAALRQLGRYDTRVKERVVVMLSFMCAGVPSLRGTYEVLQQFGVQPKQVASFRYRGEGWPGLTKAVLKDGTTHQMAYDESWGNILNRHLLLRCKICPDGTGEFADIVGADAWMGREDGYPNFEEREGKSLVIVRTEIGRHLLDLSLKSKAIIKEAAISFEEISKMQPYQANRKQSLLSKLFAMKILSRSVPRYENFMLWQATRQGSPLTHLRIFLGMLRRELIRRKQLKPIHNE